MKKIIVLLSLFVWGVPVMAQETITTTQIDLTALLTAIIAVAGVVVTVGIPASLFAVAQLIKQIRNDPNSITAMENLTNSFPPDTKSFIDKAGDFMKEAAEAIKQIGLLFKELSDDVPAVDKPAGEDQSVLDTRNVPPPIPTGKKDPVKDQ